MDIPTMDGITARRISSPRISSRVLFSGPDNGIAVLFVHGNVSSATFWEETMLALPEGFRGIAPDQRGYGGSRPGQEDRRDSRHGRFIRRSGGPARPASDQARARGSAFVERTGRLAADDGLPGAHPDSDADRTGIALRFRRLQRSGRPALFPRLRRIRRGNSSTHRWWSVWPRGTAAATFRSRRAW